MQFGRIGDKRVDAVLREVFGDDSDDDAGVPEGLHHLPGFLAPDEQARVLEAIEVEGWLQAGLTNQAMCFGNLPPWALQLAGTLPVHLLSRCRGSGGVHFDQLAVNRYAPGEGICAHVDLLRFEDGMAILSLGSSAVMSFTRGRSMKDVLLEPGDLLLLQGEARYAWKHGIAAVHTEEHDGRVIRRECRTSVTFRKVAAQHC